MTWKNESSRHSLASRGIKSKTQNNNSKKIKNKLDDLLLVVKDDSWIFEEYFEEMSYPSIKDRSLAIKEDFEEFLQDPDRFEEPLNKWEITQKKIMSEMINIINNKKYKDAWYVYFKEYESHGEYAGSVVGSLYNEGDYKGAYEMLMVIKGTDKRILFDT